MGSYREIDGDLIELAKTGEFDVIAHGCNCFCTMGAGIAPQMARAFCADKFSMEMDMYKGDINKLGTIDFELVHIPKQTSAGINFGSVDIYVINAYTQYNYGRNHIDGDEKPVNYNAISLCMQKINHTFAGKRIGLPKIGAGLAGGDWNIIKSIIQKEFKDCDVTVVNYKK